MARQTLRSQNKCEDCGYTWYPRGKNLSLACPRCKGSKVGYAGPGLFACLVGLALLYFFARTPSNSTQPTAAAEAQPTSLVEESTPALPAPSAPEAPFAALPAATAPEPIPNSPHVDAVAAKPAAETPAASVATAEASSTESPKQDAAKRVYTEDEIARMEDERQYHGDDPIVRARLGLPSKETKMLLK